MSSSVYRLKTRLRDAAIVEPNEFGIPFVTHLYRKVNRFFKTAPFIFIVPASLFASLAVVYVFGLLAVKLVSLLQYGF